MNRWDAALGIAILAAAAVAWPLATAAGGSGQGVTMVGPAGETRVSVKESGVWRVAGRSGTVVVRVDGGRAWVESSDCPDQVCVRSGKTADGSIVCAPNGVLVRVEGGGRDLDAVTR